ncbi:cysteine-rich receptor-like protein kinase 10 isoform X2 [Brachypodium distachyon]|uniref:Protein kinase domain-containing protein n=1 Tax=Brachypodium distachyon TaxID=15368 RepID=I1GV13_BRADI|nr:cysteine-rich receptor-like protein kinase 10 isoform X2 [Brachypodium distachyon]KQK16573.1 hypothetical protein BRADI_1g29350v3 [Brachypodium distachyon]PNT75271.1 hypothetical protein BRADI_1g29350v3 [Brachypodium distachyon]|eukprot:XP_024315761.1 cysteine-rich receptor-like protein kinase 10 isoform X2 [Brachypodium distachyon]
MSTRGSKTIPELQFDRLNTNFSDSICEDQFGILYKGKMDDTEIAVKELTESTEKIFKEEVQNMMAPEHENIARLVGFCSEGRSVHERPLLCYEYLPSILMTLDCYLFAEGSASSSAEHGVHWDERFTIVKGICQGLCCLHKLRVIHLDLKPANIWLDENKVPKIGCFELYRFFGQGEIIKFTGSVAGSNGYMAPEYVHDGKISAQADIYSLGLMIIEITTGVKKSRAIGQPSARKYIDEIRKEWTPEHIASQYPSYDAERLQQVYACIKVGLECVQLDREKRPLIGAIVDRLNAS